MIKYFIRKKFLLTVFLSVVMCVYLGFKIIDMAGFTTFMIPLVGGFFTGDLIEKFKLESSPEK